MRLRFLLNERPRIPIDSVDRSASISRPVRQALASHPSRGAGAWCALESRGSGDRRWNSHPAAPAGDDGHLSRQAQPWWCTEVCGDKKRPRAICRAPPAFCRAGKPPARARGQNAFPPGSSGHASAWLAPVTFNDRKTAARGETRSVYTGCPAQRSGGFLRELGRQLVRLVRGTRVVARLGCLRVGISGSRRRLGAACHRSKGSLRRAATTRWPSSARPADGRQLRFTHGHKFDAQRLRQLLASAAARGQCQSPSLRSRSISTAWRE